MVKLFTFTILFVSISFQTNMRIDQIIIQFNSYGSDVYDIEFIGQGIELDIQGNPTAKILTQTFGGDYMGTTFKVIEDEIPITIQECGGASKEIIQSIIYKSLMNGQTVSEHTIGENFDSQKVFQQKQEIEQDIQQQQPNFAIMAKNPEDQLKGIRMLFFIWDDYFKLNYYHLKNNLKAQIEFDIDPNNQMKLLKQIHIICKKNLIIQINLKFLLKSIQ